MGIFSALIGNSLGGPVDTLLAGDGGGNKATSDLQKKIDEMKKETNSNYNLGQKFLRPYESQDNQAAQRYSDLLMNPGAFSKFTTTPGYQFAMQQGTNAIQNGAAAKGGLLSGATLKGLQTYGQGMAEQYYNDYMNRLQGLQGQGQNLAVTNADLARKRGMNINALTDQFAGAKMGNDINQARTQNALYGSIGNGLGSIESLATGNPMGSLSSLSSLFGGGNSGGYMPAMQSASFGLPGAAGSGSYGLPSGGLSNYGVG